MGAAVRGGADMREVENRVFGYAVLVSIVAHGALLFALPWLRDSDRRPSSAPGPIVARLAQPRAAPAPEPAKVEAAPAPKPEPTLPATRPAPVPRSSPAARPETRPASRPAPAAPAQASAPPPFAEPAPAASAAPGAAPGLARVEPRPAAPAPAAEVPDAATLAQYRLQLMSAAKRYKRYPRVAMDNSWEGKVELRMVIGANGMIASLSVRNGTGHDVLDQQALDMVRKAKPLAPIPAALRGKEFSVDIPVIFSLKEPDA
jgi:protein TonB